MIKKKIDYNSYIERAHEAMIGQGFYDCPECDGVGYKEKDDSRVILKDDHSKCPSCNGTGINQNRNISELIMLVVSECGEALNAHRSGKRADYLWYERLIKTACNDLSKNKIFEEKIKDTLEYELAYIMIRLFDLAGYLKVEIKESDYPWATSCGKNFGEELLEIVGTLYRLRGALKAHVNDYSDIDLSFSFYDLFINIEFFAEMNEIDIWLYIEAKMKYNESRPHKHGKAY